MKLKTTMKKKYVWMLAILAICSSAAHAEDHGEQGTAEKTATIEVPQWVSRLP